MSKWRSAMPLEFGPRGAVASYAGGAKDMPDGVFPPEIMARQVATADRPRAYLGQSQRPGVVVTIAGTELPEEEIRERERLFARVRKGDRAAAKELLETRRAWIIIHDRPHDAKMAEDHE